MQVGCISKKENVNQKHTTTSAQVECTQIGTRPSLARRMKDLNGRKPSCRWLQIKIPLGREQIFPSVSEDQTRVPVERVCVSHTLG